MSGEKLRHQRNPGRAAPGPYPKALDAVLSDAGFKAARAGIVTWPGYAPTPLRERAGLAKAKSLDAVWYKDEAARFGLGSFKALGGAYAVLRVLQRKVADATATVPSARDFIAGRFDAITRGVTVTTATDGNHGRSVAWGAQLFHCRCVIFIHAAVSEGRAAAIARYGAEVVRRPGNYDDAVHDAAAAARTEGRIVVSDTSYEGYNEIPRDVMHGYGMMADEAFDALVEWPTHIFVQAGVGALAAAVAARAWQRWGAGLPRLLVVEPLRADSLLRSAKAGRPVAVGGDLATVMAGLACGEVSLLAWEVLRQAASDFIAVADDYALEAVRILAEGRFGHAPLVAGETGVAGLAALLAALEETPARTDLGLDRRARVLLFGTEGATDPEIWRQITGRAPF